MYKVGTLVATAIDTAYTGGSFSATDTQFAFPADATATQGSEAVEICYEKAVAYDATEDAALYVDVSGDAELACTATVSIINCVYDEAVALSAITHNTAFETEVDLGGLRDSILDTDACWATAVGVDSDGSPRILELVGSSDPVDHTVDTATGADSKVTLAAYNRDYDGEAVCQDDDSYRDTGNDGCTWYNANPAGRCGSGYGGGSVVACCLCGGGTDSTSPLAIPGYAVKACFDNYAGDAICSVQAALTETFDECPKAFATPAVTATYKWDVSQAVTFNFGAIRDSVNDETDGSLTPGGADNLRCWVDATDGVLFKSDGTVPPNWIPRSEEHTSELQSP